MAVRMAVRVIVMMTVNWVPEMAVLIVSRLAGGIGMMLDDSWIGAMAVKKINTEAVLMAVK